MQGSAIPKTVLKWAEANPDKVEDIHTERDDFNDRSPFSVWCYLQKGWAFEQPGGHIIHEYLVRDFMDAVQLIVPCDCEECGG